jgi:hypothetical protein
MDFALIYVVWQIFHFRNCTFRQVRWITTSQRHVGRNAHGSQRIFDLKAALFSMTDVPPERQKILGLVKGKLPPEDGRM